MVLMIMHPTMMAMVFPMVRTLIIRVLEKENASRPLSIRMVTALQIRLLRRVDREYALVVIVEKDMGRRMAAETRPFGRRMVPVTDPERSVVIVMGQDQKVKPIEVPNVGEIR
jgi:hypothetical protein